MYSASAERDDAADGIVRGDADGHAIAGYHLDPEAAHPAAQLGEHFVTRVYLHTIQTAAMNGDDGALHINEIVLAQICCPFNVPAYQYPRVRAI